MQPFNSISSLPRELIINLDALGYHEMTPIQQAAIPVILQNKDLIAQAKTGSGKTAAFGIPVVASIDTDSKDPQALIVTPTRELAEQVGNELRRLARYRDNIKIVVLAGGTPMRGQIDSLAKGADIVVGTPGRLQDHLSRDTLRLYDVKQFVLDEGDRMLDMGFMDAILKIASNLPKKRQNMLFSATFPDKIEKLSSTIMNSPYRVTADEYHAKEAIKQIAYESKIDKRKTLRQVLSKWKPRSALIFCNTKANTNSLADWLYDHGFAVDALTGDLDQRSRNEALLMFANRSTSVLVATDVASRGLDIEAIDVVINYDLPYDPEVYLHRIGRTGRSDAKGLAISIYQTSEKTKLQQFGNSIEFADPDDAVPEEKFVMLSKMRTLCIDGGKKEKLRAGDILGALCQSMGIDSRYIGKIDIYDDRSYVGLDKSIADKALKSIRANRIKKKKFRAWLL